MGRKARTALLTLSAAAFFSTPVVALRLAGQADETTTAALDVPITRQDLKSTLIVRGTVQRASSLELRVGGVGRVTKMGATVGSQVGEGTVLLWRDDRPVTATTAFVEPLYRDLSEGAKGADVVRVQQFLSQHGYVGALDGKLTAAVRRSWQAYQRAAGFGEPDGIVRVDDLVPVLGSPIVSRVSVSDGSVLAPGDVVVEVGLGLPGVLMELAPADWDQMDVGLSAVVAIRSQGASWAATIDSLSTIPTISDEGLPFYPGELSFVGAPADVVELVGRGVEVEVTLAERLQATVVPAAAVFTDNEGRSVVLVVDPVGSEAEQSGVVRQVELGIQANGYREVISGLERGEVVRIVGSIE